jgi:hypothetical protein
MQPSEASSGVRLGDAGSGQGQEPEAQIGASGPGQKKGISIMKKRLDKGGTPQAALLHHRPLFFGEFRS